MDGEGVPRTDSVIVTNAQNWRKTGRKTRKRKKLHLQGTNGGVEDRALHGEGVIVTNTPNPSMAGKTRRCRNRPPMRIPGTVDGGQEAKPPQVDHADRAQNDLNQRAKMPRPNGCVEAVVAAVVPVHNEEVIVPPGQTAVAVVGVPLPDHPNLRRKFTTFWSE